MTGPVGSTGVIPNVETLSTLNDLTIVTSAMVEKVKVIAEKMPVYIQKASEVSSSGVRNVRDTYGNSVSMSSVVQNLNNASIFFNNLCSTLESFERDLTSDSQDPSKNPNDVLGAMKAQLNMLSSYHQSSSVTYIDFAKSVKGSLGVP